MDQRFPAVLQKLPFFQNAGSHGLRHGIHVIRRLRRLERPSQHRPCHCKSHPHGCHPNGLGAGLQDDEIVVVKDFRQQALIPEVHIGFVQDHQRIHRRNQLPHRFFRHSLPRRIAGIGKDHRPHAIFSDKPDHLIHINGQIRFILKDIHPILKNLPIKPIHGKIRRKCQDPFPFLKKAAANQTDQFIRTVPRCHGRNRHPVKLGKRAAQF